jgi:hypothetical protein
LFDTAERSYTRTREGNSNDYTDLSLVRGGEERRGEERRGKGKKGIC